MNKNGALCQSTPQAPSLAKTVRDGDTRRALFLYLAAIARGTTNDDCPIPVLVWCIVYCSWRGYDRFRLLRFRRHFELHSYWLLRHLKVAVSCWSQANPNSSQAYG